MRPSRSIRRATVRVAMPKTPRPQDEIAELAALADGSLAPEDRASLEARVDESPELAARLAEQERAVAFARSAAAEVEAPAALRARIEAQRSARARRAAARRPFVLIGAAAAVAALAIGIGLNVFGSGASGEHFSAALAPTDLAPGAVGDAKLTKTSSGWRIDLRATGLPHLDAGRFYEAWLRNRAGVLVPIGTFNDARKVTLWAGVSPKQFRTLTVTRERADGAQTSSGQKVLVGKVYTGS
jgi:anti-sigma factor RsiW